MRTPSRTIALTPSSPNSTPPERARERLLMADNQLDKTIAGGFEAAMHATGRYPDWWQGRRFDKPMIQGPEVAR